MTGTDDAGKRALADLLAMRDRLARNDPYAVPAPQGCQVPLTERQADEGWCCRDDCCGPGSWCCAHANPHDHTDDGHIVPLAAASPEAPV